MHGTQHNCNCQAFPPTPQDDAVTAFCGACTTSGGSCSGSKSCCSTTNTCALSTCAANGYTALTGYALATTTTSGVESVDINEPLKCVITDCNFGGNNQAYCRGITDCSCKGVGTCPCAVSGDASSQKSCPATSMEISIHGRCW